MVNEDRVSAPLLELVKGSADCASVARVGSYAIGRT